MKTDDVLVKMVEYARFTDLVCINDFLDYYQHEKCEVGRKRYETYIEHFVEKHLKPYIARTDNPLNGKFQIKSFLGSDKWSILGKNDQKNERNQNSELEREFPDSVKRYYLVDENIEIRFITNLYDFMEGLHQKQKVETIEKVAEYEEIKSKTHLYQLRNTAEMIASREAIFEQFQKEMKKYYYRGHDSVNYKLIPKIYRDNILEFEKDLYEDWVMSRPKDFSECRRHIDVLREMQRQRIATRLLDITSNPLVGLYYAVSQKEDYDGELIIFEVDHEKQKGNVSDAVEIVSALATQSMKENGELSRAAETYKKKKRSFDETTIEEFNEQKTTKKLLHEIRRMVGDFEAIIDPVDLFKSFVMKPSPDDERLLRQADSFILSGLDSNDNCNLKYKSIASSIADYRLGAEEGEVGEKNMIRFIVPSCYKSAIRTNLSVMGINERYPSL